ncbi:MAG: radical SAM protein [Candidatus Helarchaeota archaeon]
MKYVYGPVPSRRLGRSLGIDTIPPKTCNFSCVYCQLGRTTNFTNNRKDFFPRNDIWQELKKRVDLTGIENIDYITFVGDGEPTLCYSLGWLIDQIKTEYTIPVAVITNGSLLYLEDVRNDLKSADVILPTLDAGFPETFKKINRPHPSISFHEMINGMIIFKKIYSGQIWLEFMVVTGINDSVDELNQIRKYFKKINPDRVYINIPIRPPAEKWVKIPSEKSLSQIREIFEDVVEIILPETGNFHIISNDILSLKNELIQIIKRHPMRLDQLEMSLKQNGIDNPLEIISELERDGLINRLNYQNKIFFISTELKIDKIKRNK